MSKKPTDAEIIRMIESRKVSGVNSATGQLAQRRKSLLARYLGEKYGDERKGQSSVITRQCLEAVEWTLPSLIRVFSSSDKVAEFVPVDEQDEEAAKQETLYVNHVFLKENDGFATLFTWLKDTLMNPNGYVKAYWEEKDKVTTEEYEGLTAQDLALLMQDEELKAIEQESETVLMATPMGEVPVEIFSVKFRRTCTDGRLIVSPVPAEELVVSGNLAGVSLDEADFICHTPAGVTRSDLIEMGFDKKIVETLKPWEEEAETDQRQMGTAGEDIDETAVDRTMEVIEYDEAYFFFDYNGDGVAEFRKVIRSGSTILENEEADYCPFVASCAVPMPHAHVGLGWMEMVEDLQKIYTVLTRQLLNNLYRTNNPRTIIGRGVNLSDVINDLPNSPIRATDINDIRIEPTVSVVNQVMPAFGMLDQVKESRIGVSRTTMGLDSDALANVTKGAFFGALEQSNQRVEMLARIFAEFSLKPLFLKIHRLLLTHQKDKVSVKVSGNWITVNPSEWRERNDMNICVGLGTGNKQAQLAAIEKVIERQTAMVMAGGMGTAVDAQGIFHSHEKLVEVAGLHNADKYFLDPGKNQQAPQQPQAKPEDGLAAAQMELAKVEREKAQLQAQIQNATLQFKMQDAAKRYEKEIADLQAKIVKNDDDSALKERAEMRKDHELLINSEIELAKLSQSNIPQVDAQQDAFRQDSVGV